MIAADITDGNAEKSRSRTFMLMVTPGLVVLDTRAVCLWRSATFLRPRRTMSSTVQPSRSTTMANTPVTRPMYACVLLAGLVAAGHTRCCICRIKGFKIILSFNVFIKKCSFLFSFGIKNGSSSYNSFSAVVFSLLYNNEIRQQPITDQKYKSTNENP